MSNTLRHFSRSTVFTLRAPAWIACLALLGACGGSSSNGGITAPLAPPHSVAATTPIAISGKNLAYCADEATTGPTGTNFNIANGDTDKIDSIAVAVNMDTDVVTVLNVAVPISTVTRPLAWIGNELYIVADEAADSHDWNGDTVLDDLVLLHWSAAMPTLMYIDTLSTVGPIKMVAIGTNLFYSSATVPSGAMASNLEVISSAMPLLKTPIPTTDLLGALSPQILGQDEGLIFLSLDEVVEARDLNGDSDPTDNFVLALLDGTDALGVIRNTGLAVADASSPFRARRTSTSSHDWQVGFLVNETAQGATNLNDPALFSASWLPVQCIGHNDSDTIDDVLHFLTFASWNTNPVTSPPRNTGLVGSQKIVIANGVHRHDQPRGERRHVQLER